MNTIFGLPANELYLIVGLAIGIVMYIAFLIACSKEMTVDDIAVSFLSSCFFIPLITIVWGVVAIALALLAIGALLGVVIKRCQNLKERRKSNGSKSCICGNV